MPNDHHTAKKNVERVSDTLTALKDKIKLLEKEIQLHEALNAAQKRTIHSLDETIQEQSEEIKTLKTENAALKRRVRTQHSGGSMFAARSTPATSSEQSPKEPVGPKPKR